MLSRGVCSLLLLTAAAPASVVSVESAQAASSSMAPRTTSNGSQGKSTATHGQSKQICKLIHSIQPGLSNLHALTCHSKHKVVAPKPQRGNTSHTGSTPTTPPKIPVRQGPVLPLAGPPQLK